uniref:Uncharacterized protein LOC8269748 n=1 Tax=Rhizophora mucronata TaxID=61149 RepID=A0A2P2LWT6_RHIMU
MASDTESDTSVGSKRTISEIEGTAALHLHLQEQKEREPSFSASFCSVSAIAESKELSLVVSPSPKAAQQPIQENLSPSFFRKVKCSITESDSCRQELGFEENQGILGSIAEENVSLCDLVSGTFGSTSISEDFQGKIESLGVQGGKSKDCFQDELGFSGIQEAYKKELSGEYKAIEMGRSPAIDENSESLKVNELQKESLLEAKKKQLLAEIEDGLFLKDKNHVETVAGFSTNSRILGALKGIDGSVRNSLQIEVVDDTALIGPVSVPHSGNHNINVGERTGKNEKRESDVKGKRPQRRGKNVRKAPETGESEKKTSQVGEAHNNAQIFGDQMKRKYTRAELEALRFENVVEQRKIWRNIYAGLAHSVAKEYDDLSSSKHLKNNNFNFDPQRHHRRKADGPGILGGVCSEILDNELENVEEDKLENVDLLDPPCCYSVGGGGSSGVLEREYSEEDDSDEEYDSIQRPAFLVEGEPNFDSGPPEDGLEYLRRVRWEAAHIPKVTVAKPDSSKPKREQSVYMPQIPDIAECPEHLVPSRQWEDAFLVDFSKLRWCLTQNDGSSSKISPEQQLVVIFPETDISSPQLIKSNVLEKFSKLSTDEVHSCKPTDNSTVEGNGIGQAPLLDAKESKILASPQSTTSQSIDIDDSCTYPVLSAILAMDSVARVSTLRKRTPVLL